MKFWHRVEIFAVAAAMTVSAAFLPVWADSESESDRSGDLNADGYTNTSDVVLLRRYIAGGYDVTVDELEADLNSDGYINTSDVVLLRRGIAGGYDVEWMPLPGHYTQEDVCVSPSLTGYRDFAACAEETFVVPGLSQAIVPQGMDYWAEKGLMLISGYCSKSGGGSVLLAVNVNSGRLTAAYSLKNMDGSNYTGHAGGVAVTKKNVYISDGSKLRRIPLTALERSGTVSFAEEISVPVHASFCNYSGGFLWVGDFYRDETHPTEEFRHMVNRDGTTYCAWAVGYELDETTENEFKTKSLVNGSYATPDRILSITDRIQGMAYLHEQGKIALSQSYGRKNNSTLYLFDDPMSGAAHTTVTLNNVSVPVWFLDGKVSCENMTMLPMSEGVANVNGKVYVLFESGAEKYRLDGGKMPTDMVYAVEVSK